MLCDICQEREATIHNTQIVGAVLKRSDLCDKCFEFSKPNENQGLAAALQTGCRYCGGEPYSGGDDPIAMLSGVRKVSFTCKSCADEYSRFLRQKWPGFGEPTITTEQIAKIRTSDSSPILIEADEHMEKWVADKKISTQKGVKL